MIEVGRGDVVLVAFPFVRPSRLERKRRPALVVQSDRYNRRRAAVIIVAITTTQAHRRLSCKVVVSKDSPEGRQAGLRLDSVVDCQTVATISREEIVRRLGSFPREVMLRVNNALKDALDLSRENNL